jgi:hypothetical protein
MKRIGNQQTWRPNYSNSIIDLVMSPFTNYNKLLSKELFPIGWLSAQYPYAQHDFMQKQNDEHGEVI